MSNLTTLIVSTLLLSSVYFFIENNQSSSPKLRSQDIKDESDIQQAFLDWQAKFQKHYSHDYTWYKYQNFKANHLFIQGHNSKFQAGETTFELDHNEFSDMTNDEFKQIYLGFNRQAAQQKHVKYIIGHESTPDSLDWTEKGAVTPVKNQGQCGSCWAFSTTGSLEGANQIKNNNLLSFSEQELVDCSSSQGNQGCNGGLMDYAFEYVKTQGIALESDYTYNGSTNSCTSSKASKVAFKISSYSDVPQNSTSQMVAALQRGPVSVAIDAGSLWFQFYRRGVYQHNCGLELDHGVLAVGYGTDNGTPYYKVKNSWGSSWGQNGYIELLRNDGPGECGIHLSASYPVA